MTEFLPPCTCPSIDETGKHQHLVGCPRYGYDAVNVDKSTQVVITEDKSSIDDKYCGAKRRQAPELRCRRPAGWGTDHVGTGSCKLHGGNMANHRKRGQKKLAIKARDTYGLPTDVDPAQALLEEVHRTAGHVAWLHLQVQALKRKQLAWGKTKFKQGGDDHGTTYEAKENAYLALYRQERKHLVHVCDVAIKAGVEEKRLTLEQQRAEMVVEMLGGIFDNLELTPEQSLKLEELVPKALTAIAALEAK